MVKGFTINKNPNLKETIMKIEFTTKKDLIKQIAEKGLEPLSINATVNDMKLYLNRDFSIPQIKATIKKAVK